MVCKFLDASSRAKGGDGAWSWKSRPASRDDVGERCQESSCAIVSSKTQLKLELLEAVCLNCPQASEKHEPPDVCWAAVGQLPAHPSQEGDVEKSCQGIAAGGIQGGS